MTHAFVGTPELYNDLPPEVQFIEGDHDHQSMVQFLDSTKTIQQGSIEPTDDLAEQRFLGG